MASGKIPQLISLQELCTMLTICEKLVALSHPTAALMIRYAAKDLNAVEAPPDGSEKVLERTRPRAAKK